MAKRTPKRKKAVKKTVKRKSVKKSPVKKKVPAKKKAAPKAKKTTMSPADKNREAQWKVYHHLRSKADAAIAKLTADMKRKAPADVILKDRNELLLILGECHYMASECSRFSKN
jgi:hypothetical protein